MKSSDLINAIKDREDLSAKDAKRICDTFFSSIKDTLANGERVEIRGFGSFMVKDYKPYVGRNPKTGAQIRIPAKKLPFFKVGKELKEKVDK